MENLFIKVFCLFVSWHGKGQQNCVTSKAITSQDNKSQKHLQTNRFNYATCTERFQQKLTVY